MSTMETHLILYLLLFLFSCNSSTEGGKKDEPKTSKPFIVNLEENISNFEVIKMSQLFDSIQYIQIETNKKCLIKDARKAKIIFTDNFMFISEFRQLLQFKKSGKFVKQIGRNGKGPGEYTGIRTCTVDEKGKLIYVVENWSKKIHIYNFDGNFIRDLSTEYDIKDILFCSDENLICSITNVNKNIDPEPNSVVIISSKKGNTVAKFNNYHKRKSDNVFENFLYKVSQEIHFNEAFSDTIFRIDETNLQFKLVGTLNFGKYKFKDYKTNTQRPLNFSLILGLVESKNHLFISYVANQKDSLFRAGIYDKITGSFCNVSPYLKNGYKGYPGIYNDFDGILHFWPKQLNNDGTLLQIFDAYRLKSIIALNKKHSIPQTSISKYSSAKLIRIIDNITESSNGIICIAYPKKTKT